MAIDSVMKSVNLDEFLEEFGRWKKASNQKITENITLKEEIKQLKKQLKLAKRKEENNLKEISQLSTIIEDLHITLEKLTHLEYDNKKLKEELEILNEETKRTELKHSEAEKRFNLKLEEVTGKYLFEIQHLKHENDQNIKKNGESFEKKIKGQEREIEETKHKFSQQMKEKEENIARLELEYEGKIKKLKDQLVKASKSNNVTHTGKIQEIYRQKQQHMKQTYENIIATLKENIYKLEQEKELHQSKNDISYSLNNDKRSDLNSTVNENESAVIHTMAPFSSTKGDEVIVKSASKKRKLFQPEKSFM